jgi:hypothetical protein
MYEFPIRLFFQILLIPITLLGISLALIFITTYVTKKYRRQLKKLKEIIIVPILKFCGVPPDTDSPASIEVNNVFARSKTVSVHCYPLRLGSVTAAAKERLAEFEGRLVEEAPVHLLKPKVVLGEDETPHTEVRQELLHVFQTIGLEATSEAKPDVRCNVELYSGDALRMYVPISSNVRKVGDEERKSYGSVAAARVCLSLGRGLEVRTTWTVVGGQCESHGLGYECAERALLITLKKLEASTLSKVHAQIPNLTGANLSRALHILTFIRSCGSVPYLIGVLRNTIGSPRAKIIEALQDITGENMGDSPEEWLKWWRESQRNKEDMHTQTS